VLLAQTGAPQARAALRYGDGLAGALWRHRLRTLHTAETLRSYEQLRAEHERVSRSADTDALTGVLNRRVFDRELARLAGSGGAGTTAGWSSTWTNSNRSTTRPVTPSGTRRCARSPPP